MYIKLIKSNFFKPSLCLMALAMMIMSFTAPAGKMVVLKSGTTIPLELMSTVSSKTALSGQRVRFRVTSDIKVEGMTAIKAGMIAEGQVVRSKKNGLLGSNGMIEIKVSSVKAVDGTMVNLMGDNLNDEGKNKAVVSVVFTILCLFGFLIKGQNGEIPAGMGINAITMSDTEINVD